MPDLDWMYGYYSSPKQLPKRGFRAKRTSKHKSGK